MFQKGGLIRILSPVCKKKYLVVLVTILGADLDRIGSLDPCSEITGDEWCSGAIENLC